MSGICSAHRHWEADCDTCAALPLDASQAECWAEAESKLKALNDRLDKAEAVCLMYGWSAFHTDSPREKALYELWVEWRSFVPTSFTSPDRHPELSDEVVERLAAQRDARRTRTMSSISNSSGDT